MTLRLLSLFILVMGAFASRAAAEDPRRLAEEQFLLQLNSMEGIEVIGGPFRTANRHFFGGESGYFIIEPEIPVTTLDQHVTIQTRVLDLTPGALPTPPLAAPAYPSDVLLSRDRRSNLLKTLARFGLGEKRDEVTVLDPSSISVRPVFLVPIVTIRSLGEEQLGVLLGAQLWQGVPLAKASFDRKQGGFDLEWVTEGLISRQPKELQYRPGPFLPPQTFYADPGMPAPDWKKLLLEFARVDRFPPQIIRAQVSDGNATLFADFREPPLPGFCAALRPEGTQWETEWVVEFRADFPRPAPSWAFLPMLEKPGGPEVSHLADRLGIRPLGSNERPLLEILLRLRAVGAPLSVTFQDQVAFVKTAHTDHTGYDLEFRKITGQWRLTSLSQWTS